MAPMDCSERIILFSAGWCRKTDTMVYRLRDIITYQYDMCIVDNDLFNFVPTLVVVR